MSLPPVSTAGRPAAFCGKVDAMCVRVGLRYTDFEKMSKKTILEGERGKRCPSQDELSRLVRRGVVGSAGKARGGDQDMRALPPQQGGFRLRDRAGKLGTHTRAASLFSAPLHARLVPLLHPPDSSSPPPPASSPPPQSRSTRPRAASSTSATPSFRASFTRRLSPSCEASSR